tara:strand:- start:128 stop:295 length:168 start_codon:yes stop_codon:yes gene_type:complete
MFKEKYILQKQASEIKTIKLKIEHNNKKNHQKKNKRLQKKSRINTGTFLISSLCD